MRRAQGATRSHIGRGQRERRQRHHPYEAFGRGDVSGQTRYQGHCRLRGPFRAFQQHLASYL